ncbi:hypothetical protein NDN08_001385 [Rhodosorus marinus]|uniref:Magnesium and cobalt transport protein CorA n=1 Tax=Rhodosorus marinus TaxID=101924 RepID=A0AAV8UWG7_9RHOD|nr:hypothetical protein NDN08_001385 [Rhodosorus marinus]
MEKESQDTHSRPIWIVSRRRHGSSSSSDGGGDSGSSFSSETSPPSLLGSSRSNSVNRYDLPEYETDTSFDLSSDEEEEVYVQVVKFSHDSFESQPDVSLNGLLHSLGQQSENSNSDEPQYWIRVCGREDSKQAVSLFRKLFKLHDVAADIILKTPQRPKMLSVDSTLLLISHIPSKPEDDSRHYIEMSNTQLGLMTFLGSHFCVSFHDEDDQEVRNWTSALDERIRINVEGFRHKKASALVPFILRAVVDKYFPLLESYSDDLEELEEWLMTGKSSKNVAKAISRVKRDMSRLRRVIWPMREYIADAMMSDFFPDLETKRKMQELYEHLTYLADMVETQRDISAGLVDLYLSSQDHKTQEVMQRLTVIGATFIPFSFFAGVYGMNFEVGSIFPRSLLGRALDAKHQIFAFTAFA